MVFALKDGQREVMSHGYVAREDDEKGGQYLDEDVIHPELAEEHIDEPADEARHGVDVFAEDERHLVEADVAEEPAESAGDDAHHDRNPVAVAHHERPLDAHDGKEPEADGVEDEESRLHVDEVVAKEHHDQKGGKGDEDIRRCEEPKGGQPEHQVAYRPAADSRQQSHDEGAEEVDLLPRRQARPGDGEGERPQVVEELRDAPVFLKELYALG